MAARRSVCPGGKSRRRQGLVRLPKERRLPAAGEAPGVKAAARTGRRRAARFTRWLRGPAAAILRLIPPTRRAALRPRGPCTALLGPGRAAAAAAGGGARPQGFPPGPAPPGAQAAASAEPPPAGRAGAGQAGPALPLLGLGTGGLGLGEVLTLAGYKSSIRTRVRRRLPKAK